MVVGIKLLVAPTCLIDGDAGSSPNEIGLLLLCSCPEFCGAAEEIEKGSRKKDWRTGADRNLWTLFRRDLQNHIKPTTSTKKPTTPPTIGPIMTVDLPLALLELVALAVAGDEAPVVVVDPVGTALNVTPYKKKSKESGVVWLEGWDIQRPGRTAQKHLQPW